MKQVTQHMDSVLSHTDSSVPSEIANNNPARAYYDLSLETFKTMTVPDTFPIEKIALDSALAMDAIIRKYILDEDKPIIDWTSNTNLIGQMKINMEDYLIDEVKRKHDIPMSFDDMGCYHRPFCRGCKIMA